MSQYADISRLVAPFAVAVCAAATAGCQAGSDGRSGAPETAPGVVGDTASMETFQWIWELERIPFPDRIDEGQWTDYYFSADAGGAAAEGDDVRGDGLGPGTAWETLDKAREVCFAAPYTRCNFDSEIWDEAGDDDHGDGFRTLTDADVDTTGCPQDFLGAHEQPCFWLRSFGGGRAEFDARGSTTWGSCWSIETIHERAHVVVEGIDLTCDSLSGSGVPLDAFERSIVTFVGSDLTNGADRPGGTDQVISPHDVSVTHLYGKTNIGYASPGGASGANPALANGGSAALAVHSAGRVTPCDGCNTFTTNQSSGSFDPSLEAEAVATPAVMFLSGLKLRGSDLNSAIGSVFASDENAAPQPVSNHAIGIYLSVGVFPDAGDASGSSIVQALASVSGDSTIDVRWIHPTFHMDASGATVRLFSIGSRHLDAGDRADILLAGGVVEPSIGDDLTENAVRFKGSGWSDSPSRLRIVDTVYDRANLAWRIDDPQDICREDTATDLAACINPIRDPPIEIANALVVTPLQTGRATGGSPTTLVDAGAFAGRDWSGAVLRLTAGPGHDQTRTVVSNTDDVLSVDNAWGIDGDPAAGTGYSLAFYTDDDGVCLEGEAACDSIVRGAAADYARDLPERVQIPAFIGGRRLTRFAVDPARHDDAGRIGRGP